MGGTKGDGEVGGVEADARDGGVAKVGGVEADARDGGVEADGGDGGAKRNSLGQNAERSEIH